ncbi:MAG: adenine deaminase [Chloroflexi bacterium]|nr:adenine deaminase [Chloroflexota bacterium]
MPADLILANAQIINTFTAEIEKGNVAIYRGRIAGIGDYRDGKETIDLGEKYLAPGLINGHTHPESSMLNIDQYALALVPRGTTSVVTDFHEIANVCGLRGLKQMLDWARRLPIDFFLMVPPCVPATSLETAGAEVTPEDIRKALRWKNTIGLGEMMNFPGLLAGDKGVLQKITMAGGRLRDGHAPGLGGKSLNAYLSAGIGSCHETTALEEGREKLRRGMHLMIREGSSEKNLETLLPLVNDNTYRRCILVVDDRSCVDLLSDGDIDAVVRKAIKLGLPPLRAIQMATINPAEYFRLPYLGAVAPGYFANLIVLGDISRFQTEMVFYRGRLVAREGKPLFPPSSPASGEMTRTMRVKPFGIEALALASSNTTLPVIELVPHQIITKFRQERPKRDNSLVLPDPERDILKLVVVERHKATGNIGLGLVKGFGLKKGALASSVAHDSHNIVAVGTNDRDTYIAIKEVERLGGGLVVANGKTLKALALPMAGLLSQEPLENVAANLRDLERAAVELGVRVPSPFTILSFLALPVIPELRLTDKGLVDVVKGAFLPKTSD